MRNCKSILTALEYLPKNAPKPIQNASRSAFAKKEIIKRPVWNVVARKAPQVSNRQLKKALVQINGEPGDPRSFDALDQLLNAQSYRLGRFWRVAAEEN